MIRAEANAEEQLLAFARQLGSTKMGWQAVHLHLSRLSRFSRKDYNLRIALNALNDVTKRFEGRIFLLDNHDIVMLVKGALVSEVNEAIFHANYLFQDDPQAANDDSLSTWFDLSIRYDALMATIEGLLRDKGQRKADAHNGAAGEEIEPMDVARLQKVLGALNSLDLSTYVRRQPICLLAEGTAPRPVFEELYVRIADLQRPLMPNVDFLANRWLFQHFTESLDTRVLALLTRNPETHLSGPTSINLNVDTILSQRFIDFDSAIRAGTQKSIVLELQLFDVISDVGAFQFARDFARNKGYRISLDGLTALSFTLIEFANLKPDLFKVYWDDAMVNMARQKRAADLAAAIKRHGAERVILARCDNENAVKFGIASGVHLFQGRHVDQLVDPASRRRN
jgi:EAL domain-containing protein (putative c-di-GMP-specific phosphodiesterase class I)